MIKLLFSGRVVTVSSVVSSVAKAQQRLTYSTVSFQLMCVFFRQLLYNALVTHAHLFNYYLTAYSNWIGVEKRLCERRLNFKRPKLMGVY